MEVSLDALICWKNEQTKAAALKLFGLKQNATKDDLNKAYREIASKYHPDKSTGDNDTMKLINGAKDFLMADLPNKFPNNAKSTDDFRDNQSKADFDMDRIFEEWLKKNRQKKAEEEWQTEKQTYESVYSSNTGSSKAYSNTSYDTDGYRPKKKKTGIKILLCIAAAFLAFAALGMIFSGEKPALIYGSHCYYIYRSTGYAFTWEEAQMACEYEGGRLCTITTDGEFDALANELNNHEHFQFFIGGRRTENDLNYYWIDQTGEIDKDAKILPENSHWATITEDGITKREPSYGYAYLNSDKNEYENVDETVITMAFVNKKWQWLDVPENILSIMPDWQDKYGFICEIAPSDSLINALKCYWWGFLHLLKFA